MAQDHRWTAERLTSTVLKGPPPTGFDCGREEQNDFLYSHAWIDYREYVSTTYLFLAEGRLAAYATVLWNSLPLTRRERGSIRYKYVSALKLGQLGVDRTFHGQGLGNHVVAFMIDSARADSAPARCRYLTLDARPDLVDWYARQGFVPNELRQQERIRDAIEHHRDPATIPVSMRFDLRTF